MDINATLLGQAIGFALLIGFAMKFIWPPLLAAIDERRESIAAGLAAADRGKRELAEAGDKVKDLVREAREDAQRIVDQANRRSVEMVDEAKGQARAEGERLVTAARAEIQQEVERARQALRTEVANLAVVGAGRILEREVDAKAHAKMLDDLAAQV
jgi:F-type H+-transporting ATPase subunit b